MSKRTNRRKTRDDGKQIASLEQAVHKLKDHGIKEEHERARHIKSGKPNTPLGSAKGRAATMGELEYLLGSDEEQKAAWLTSILNVEEYAARIPSSQTLGAYPVDLFRKTLFEDLLTSTANNVAFVTAQADCWDQVSSGNYIGLLPSGPTQSAPCTLTTSNYPNASFPASNVLIASVAGQQSFILEDVSPDFTSSATTGTEYIMVGSHLEVSAKAVAGAAANNAYSGRAHIVYSLDIDRFPISGQTIDQLRNTALQDGADIFVRTFLILPNGMFSPEDTMPAQGFEGPAMAYASISCATIPLQPDCYEWRRIGSATTSVNDPTYTTYVPIMGICLEAPGTTSFEARWTGLWQTERYPSNKVEPQDNAAGSGPAQPGTKMFMHNGVASPYPYAIGSTTPGEPVGNRRRGRTRSYQLDTGESFMVHPPTAHPKRPPASGVSGGMTPKKTPLKERGPPPPVCKEVHLLTGHHLLRLGTPMHPLAGAAAVVARAATLPGVHNQMVRAGPAGIANLVADPQIAADMVRKGPQAMETVSSGWSWKKFLSGAWDVAKVLGPALIKLLI